eukprot:204755-Hanusia_phi.AAC.1
MFARRLTVLTSSCLPQNFAKKHAPKDLVKEILAKKEVWDATCPFENMNVTEDCDWCRGLKLEKCYCTDIFNTDLSLNMTIGNQTICIQEEEIDKDEEKEDFKKPDLHYVFDFET